MLDRIDVGRGFPTKELKTQGKKGPIVKGEKLYFLLAIQRQLRSLFTFEKWEEFLPFLLFWLLTAKGPFFCTDDVSSKESGTFLHGINPIKGELKYFNLLPIWYLLYFDATHHNNLIQQWFPAIYDWKKNSLTFSKGTHLLIQIF